MHGTQIQPQPRQAWPQQELQQLRPDSKLEQTWQHPEPQLELTLRQTMPIWLLLAHLLELIWPQLVLTWPQLVQILQQLVLALMLVCLAWNFWL